MYRFGSGGLGGGLELVSRSKLSVLCETRIGFKAIDCSNIFRSLGVNGISGKDVRCTILSTECRCIKLHGTSSLLLLSFNLSLVISISFCKMDSVSHPTDSHRTKFRFTCIAVSTRSTVSLTFSLFKAAQFSSFSLSRTSSHSLIKFPSEFKLKAKILLNLINLILG